MNDLLAPRRTALDLLVACLDKGQPLDEALSRHNGFGLDRATGPRSPCCSPLTCGAWAKSTKSCASDRAAIAGRNALGASDPAAGRRAAALPRTPAHAAVDTSVRLMESTTRHISRGSPTPYCAKSRATRGVAGRPRSARLNTPHWLWDGWDRNLTARHHAAIAAAHSHRGAARSHGTRPTSPLGRTPGGGCAAAGTLRRPAGRRHRRPAGVRRRHVVGAGCRRHPARPPAGRHQGKARRRSVRGNRAARLCSSARQAPRSPPSTSRTAGWPGWVKT